MRKWIIPLLIGLFVTTLFLHSWLAWQPASAEEKKAAGGTKWVYKVVAAKENPAETEKTLNQLGAQGWELSSTVMTRASMGTGAEAQHFAPQQFTPNFSLSMQTQLILRRLRN